MVVAAAAVLRWGGTSCSRMLANISLHTHTHNQLLHVCKRLLQHSPVLLSHLLPRTSFVPFLLVSSHSHLARLYSSPSFFHLKASNIHHPSAQIHSAPRAAVRRAQQGESSEWTKYEDISSSKCLHQSGCSGESR